ncbi:MAG: DUF2726 domain-containing protein [Gallionella sp.]
MQKKKALSSRELETEKILQAALPEYTIRANMRLVDVIHAGRQYIYMRGYHLDFVISDKNANTIAAVELDDSTHDTEDGKRRDANKSRWMTEAKIQLIRIRTPEEAHNIRTLIKQPIAFSESSERVYAFEKKTSRTSRTEKTIQAFFIKVIFGTIVGAITIWGLNSVAQNTIKNIGKTATDTQKQIAEIQANARLRAQQETSQAEASRRIDTIQPHYEQRMVKGKPVRECQDNGAITNASVLCMKDHYEAVLVSGN